MLENLLLRTTGTMTKKTIVQTCNKIGEELAMATRADGKLTPEKVIEVLAEKIGKKNTEKIIVTSDKDSFVKFATDNGIMDEYGAGYFFDNSLSAVLPGAKTKNILLSLRLNDMTPEVAVNTSTHELEHVLNIRHGIRANFEKLYIAIRGQKWVQKYAEKYGPRINKANIGLQQDLLCYCKMFPTAIGGHISEPNLLKRMGIGNEEELKTLLHTLINGQKERKNKKLNLNILKALKVSLKDESRAYKAGGRAERCYEAANAKIEPKGNTKSEVLAELYDLALETLKPEIKKARKAYYKDIFRKIFHLNKNERKVGLHISDI